MRLLGGQSSIRLPILKKMINTYSKTQTARILAAFIHYSDEKRQIDDQTDLFQELNTLFSNGNLRDQRLYEMNAQGIIYFEQVGEDGFQPITMMGCTERTTECLATLIREIEQDSKDLERRLIEVLTFSPDRLKAEIENAEGQLKEARKLAEENELLQPILKQILSIEQHFHGVATVADKYEEVYKNIIRPVQLEGEAGVKATVRWAIIGIFASTLVSIALGSWKDIVAIFERHP